MKEILIPVAILGAMGLIFGVLLGIASKIFSVKKDERISEIEEVLPGANCGGCGFAGCSAYAKAIVESGAKISLCSAGGQDAADNIAKIMGMTSEKQEKTVARVFCKGALDKANVKLEYVGVADCFAASRIAGGPKECEYGCIGLGSCVSVCKFGALSVVDGVAVVDEEKCVSCGACVKKCPKNLIKIVPAAKHHAVLCSNKDKGIVAKNLCKQSCIGCGICVKNCPNDAIKVENNLARIDYDICWDCGVCAEKCPKKIIV